MGRFTEKAIKDAKKSLEEKMELLFDWIIDLREAHGELKKWSEESFDVILVGVNNVDGVQLYRWQDLTRLPGVTLTDIQVEERKGTAAYPYYWEMKAYYKDCKFYAVETNENHQEYQEELANTIRMKGL